MGAPSAPPALRGVLDLGCGTGSLSLVLAEQGHRPVGADLAPLMVEQAMGSPGPVARPGIGESKRRARDDRGSRPARRTGP
ncbi:class I SAM-dependent methyltransferase [Streptosporangium sp. NPDC048865]|uniref:class I SAM-dependent methyltransferase n=1 Tax=Streptosporangium sp. NPDC048865 TaxID=3155766 RepID=UPI00342747A9